MPAHAADVKQLSVIFLCTTYITFHSLLRTHKSVQFTNV